MGLYFCRICKVGGPSTVKESDEGYHALYEVGNPRKIADNLDSIKAQLELASHGVAAPIEAKQTETGVKDKIAQHWIDIMLERARNLKKLHPGKPDTEISSEVTAWLNSQTKKPYNPLLDTTCMWVHS